MEGDRGCNAVQETHSKDTAEKKFRNGRESLEILPLWKGTQETMASRGPAARIRRKRSSTTAENRWKCCRCGKGPKRQWRPEGLQQGCGGKEVPQRQRIAGNGAVVERDPRDNGVLRACSKDAAEKPFHNGREMRNMLPLWKENGRAAGRLRKLCRNTGPLPCRSEATKPSP